MREIAFKGGTFTMFLVNITNIKLNSLKVENILHFAGNFKTTNPEVLDYILINFQIENFNHLKGLLEY